MLNYKSFVANEVLTLSQIDSTNNYAHTLIANKQSSNGLFVVAQNQQNGKGQRGNDWYSGLPDEQFSGSLIVHHTQSSPQNMFVLNMAVSLAVLDTLKIYIHSQDVAIKWSNDILVNHKKIAGILIENIIRGNEWTHSIIGIGLNVNNILFPDYLPKAISIKQITNNTTDLKVFSHELLFNLNFRLQSALRNANEISENYNQFLYKKSEVGYFILDGKQVLARTSYVDVDGYLHVDLENNSEKFLFGDIKQIIDGATIT